MKSFCIFDSHHLYLQPSEWFSSHSIYSHIRRRNIPSITSLHESMRSLQRRIAHLSRCIISGTLKSDSHESFLSFSDSFSLVPSASADSYLTCSLNNLGSDSIKPDGEEHVGQCRAFFDPLSREWVVWNTCCGKGRTVLTLPDEILQENILKTIFEYTPDAPTPSSLLMSQKFC
jgi:hypothetical protein